MRRRAINFVKRFMRKKQSAASTITIISLIASGTIFSVTVFIKSSIIRFLRTPFGVNLFCSAEDEVPRRRSYDLCACEIASVFAACHVIKIQSCFFAPDMIYLKKKRSASSLRECPNRPCRETARVFRYPEYNVRIGRRTSGSRSRPQKTHSEIPDSADLIPSRKDAFPT